MKRAILLLISVGLVLTACALPKTGQAALPAPAAPAEEAPVFMAEEAVSTAKARVSVEQDLGPVPRMIVQRASLALVVRDTRAAMESIRQLAESVGGYVSETNAYRVNEQLQAQMTIRIPAAELENVLTQLRQMAVRVDRENLSTEDVTAEYTDLDSRLRNLEATEQELLALLREVRERPNATAEDILSVHRRLTEVREEIERLKGRKQYLENQVTLATVTIELIPDELAGPLVEPGWQPLRTLRNALRALVRALQWLLDAAIWIVVVVVPILALISIPFVVVILLIRRLQRRRRRDAGS